MVTAQTTLSLAFRVSFPSFSFSSVYAARVAGSSERVERIHVYPAPRRTAPPQHRRAKSRRLLECLTFAAPSLSSPLELLNAICVGHEGA